MKTAIVHNDTIEVWEQAQKIKIKKINLGVFGIIEHPTVFKIGKMLESIKCASKNQAYYTASAMLANKEIDLLA